MPQGCGVENQKVRRLIKRKARDVLDVAPQVLRQIMDHGARRARGCRPAFQAKPIEGCDLEMFAQRKLRGLRREDPIIVRA